VRAGPGRTRAVHLVLENDRNEARYLAPMTPKAGRCLADAQWNDDMHHALHVLATGETDGYYRDYAAEPLRLFGRALAEGFAYQGEPSAFRGGDARAAPRARTAAGWPSSMQLQTHDQVGNRAFGERSLSSPPRRPLRSAARAARLRAAGAAPPLLFMGEEFAAKHALPLLLRLRQPRTRAAVTEGRRREFGRFARFADPALRATSPTPTTHAPSSAAARLARARAAPARRLAAPLHPPAATPRGAR
jgi:maltooligosyltrehalose trehalohydrolase